MKTMIWKELRENARWAAVGFLCLLLAEMFALSSARQGDWTSDITLCDSTFLLVSAFGCAAIGAALGALQILPELRRDQWAALLHRPVSRGVIFGGKVSAGLFLYFAATALPLLASVIYVGWPGQFPAPLVPGLALPALSDLLLGVVFYFAAILLGLHRGRWFGARGAIAFASVVFFAAHLKGGYPFLLPSVAAGVLFAAAGGAMLGSLRARPWCSRLALGLVIFAGLAAACGSAWLAVRWPSGNADIFAFTDFRIASDGSVFLSTRDKHGSTLTDLQGHAVSDERYLGNNAEQSFLYPARFASGDTAVQKLRTMMTRESQTYLTPIAQNYAGKEAWYLIPGARSHFVGYDALSARRIGICDADGFHAADAVPRPFSTEPQSNSFARPYLCWVGPQVYVLDFTERRMTPLFHAGAETIEGASPYPYNTERHRIAIALVNEVRLLEPDGAPIARVPHAHERGLWSEIGITATEDFSRTFLKFSPSYLVAPQAQRRMVFLDVIDAGGQRVQSYEREQPVSRPRLPVWRARLAAFFEMPILTLVLHASAGASQNSGLAAIAVCAAFFAALAFAWARRAGLSVARTTMWIALSLIFGAAGLLAYRLASDWPALVRCPQCGRRRAVTSGTCPHCDGLWGAPIVNGTEIFEFAEN